MNKIVTLVLVSLLSTNLLLSQEADNREPCTQCFPKDSIFMFRNIESCCNTETDPAIQARLDRRKRNYHFYKTMLKIQPPSLLSGGGLTSFTHNTLGYDKKNFILDADVQTPIPIGGKRFGLNTIHIIPRFMVRIFQDDANVPFGPRGDTSLAVRTPSTIPGIVWYFSPKGWWDPERYYDKELKRANKQEGRVDDKLRDNRYLGLFIFHYSNGQDGSEFAVNDSVNAYNGNYGEQVIFEFIYGQQRVFAPWGEVMDVNKRRKRETINRNEPGKEVFVKASYGMELNWRLSFEWHPYFASSKVYRDLSQYGDYPKRSRILGRARLNGRASLHLVPALIEYLSTGDKWCLITPESNYERWRFMANFTYILDNDYYRGSNVSELKKVKFLGIDRRLNLSLTAFHVIKRSKYSAVFAEASYFGSDPYNIYFNESLWQFRFGFAFGFFDQPEKADQ